MRPIERLLRKDIPKEAIRKELERWSDRLSNLNEFFTAVLVLGLVIEYLPEITYFLRFFSLLRFSTLVGAHIEQLRQFGGLLVIVGVVGEFGVASQDRKVESDLRNESDTEIAPLNAETERLRKENAVLLRDRTIGDPLSFREAMSKFEGTACTFEVEDDRESRRLLSRLSNALRESGWRVLGEPNRRLNLGEGVCVNTVGREGLPSEACEALSHWLNLHEVATITNVVRRDESEQGKFSYTDRDQVRNA